MVSLPKILVLTISHPWCDSRVYFKVIGSLCKKKVQILLYTGNKQNSNYIKCYPNFAYTIIRSSHKLSLLLQMIIKGFRYRPDIIICIEPLSLIAGLFLKKILSCRLIYDCHEYYAEAAREEKKIYSSFYWKVESFLASKTDAILTVNLHLSKKFTPLQKNTFECSNLPLREVFLTTQQVYPREYDLIYVGGISFARGLKIFLETINLFKKHQKTIKFCLIGIFQNRTTEEFFFNFLKINQLNDYIIYKPFLPNNLIYEEIRKAKLGIFLGDLKLAARYNQSISMKVFEYFTQKTPVIINQLEMLGEMVKISQGGWIIEYDSQELFLLLRSILGDEQLLRLKGEQGFNYTIKNYVWEKQESILYAAIFGN